jgi:hypothetical protein
VLGKLRGPGEAFFKHIMSNTNVTLTLRGRGSVCRTLCWCCCLF